MKTELPDIGSISNWAQFSKQTEDYLLDHFPARSHLIGAVNYARHQLGYSGLPAITVGRSGWLFIDGEDMATAQGAHMPDQQALDIWLDGLRQRVTRASAFDAKMVFVVAPEKQSIYLDELPADVVPATRTLTDPYLETAAKIDQLTVIDARPALRAAARDAATPVYTPWDTHWTGDGAYLAYSSIISAMDQAITPLPLTAFSPWPTRTYERNSLDLANMLGIGRTVRQIFTLYDPPPPKNDRIVESIEPGVDGFYVIHTGNDGPSAVLVADSFGNALLPFLEAHYSAIVMMHPDYRFPSPEIMQKYSPDVVIYEIAERNVRWAMWPLKD